MRCSTTGEVDDGIARFACVPGAEHERLPRRGVRGTSPVGSLASDCQVTSTFGSCRRRTIYE